MITLDVKQGSPEWHAARLGLPTASRFKEIITAKTGQPSDSAKPYVWELCAEWLLGAPVESASSGFMERGSAIERQAVAAYKIERPGLELTAPGFCLTDDRRSGCSPDRLVGDDGGLEIKCPGAKSHLGYVLGERADEHRPQVQGCLWITGRKWWDQLSFHPEMPPALIRWERDEPYIGKIDAAVRSLIERMDKAKAKLLELGFEPREPVMLADVAEDTDAAMFGPPSPEQARVAQRARRARGDAVPKLPDVAGKPSHERFETLVDYVALVAGCSMNVADAAVKIWMSSCAYTTGTLCDDKKWHEITLDVQSRDWVGACGAEPQPV